MKGLKALLILLFSSLAITGASFIDGVFWNAIFYIIGLFSYWVVSLLFWFKIIGGKEAGKQINAFVFVLLLVLTFQIYRWLQNLMQWINSIPTWIKIVLPSTLLLLLIAVFIIYLVVKKRNIQLKEKL